MTTWQSLVFQTFLKGSGKRCIDAHTGKAAISRTWEDVQKFSSFGGILKPGIIDISFDDPEISKHIIDIIKEHGWSTVILQNPANGHIHTYWRNDKQIQRGGKDKMLAAGISADMHDKGTYIPLRVDKIDRFPPIYEPPGELDAVPPAFIPVKSKAGLYGLKNGDGRNQILFSWILTLQAAGLTVEQIRDLYETIINPHILADAMSADELALILRDDAFRSDIINLDQFHTFNDKGKPTGAYDYAIREHIIEHGHIFILGGVPYVYEHGVYLPDVSGSNLFSMIEKYIYPEFIRSTTLRRIYDLIVADIRLQRSDDEVNQYPHTWINFKNGMYDPIRKEMHPHDPSFYAVNQIPHDYHPGEKLDGSEIEKWLDFITSSDDEKEMLLQFVGYCMTVDTSQQKFLILNGGGGTGKSTVIRMIEEIVGDENTSNISLADLCQRFTSISLMGKLLNSCADLEVEALEDTSTLKKLLGEDRIKGEAKGKDQIFFRNYAKLIFSTNELPIVKSEKTSGFYRRLMILTMDRQPLHKQADYFRTLAAQTDYLIDAAVKALGRMYEAGSITEAASSNEAVACLWMDSDTVEAFLHDEIYGKMDGQTVERGWMFQSYYEYCVGSERRPLTRNKFYRSLRIKNICEVVITGKRYFRHSSFEQVQLLEKNRT